jgi:hypothetical protein
MEKLNKKSYPKLVNLIRGTIINACINLEIIIDLYISERFADTDEKINELSSLIITPRVTWGEKLNVLKLLMKKYHPKFAEDKKEIFSNIKNIIEHRNVFAHYPINLSEKAIDIYNKEGKILFTKVRALFDEKDKIVKYGSIPYYTNEKINEIITVCNYCIKEIKTVLRTGKK